MRSAGRFAAAMVWRDLRLALTSRTPFIFDLLGALGALGLYYFVGRFVRPGIDDGGLGFFAFATAGVAVLRLQGSLAKSALNLEREQSSGTLELIFLSPVRPLVVASGTCLYELARGLWFAALVLLGSRYLFGAGLTLGPRAWPGIACGLLGAGLFFVTLHLAACAVLVTLRQASAFAGLMALALPVLSGALYPASVLPQPVEAFAQGLPLTIAIDLVRHGIVDATFAPLRALLMFAILAALLPVAAVLFSFALAHAKRAGTLGHQ
jgi:ABC-2 type transport system permease protein